MKKIFLIIFLLLLAYEAYPQVRLSTMDSVTSFQPTDLFWLNTKSGASFVNRKVSWSYLRSNMVDYIDGLANTWAQKQTFSSGAIFPLGSNGYVEFFDSTLTTGLWTNWLHARTLTAVVGHGTEPFWGVYTKNLYIMNQWANDSVGISYDDSALTIDKTLKVSNIEITEQLQVPDSASFSGLALSQAIYQPTLASDSIITLSNVESSIVINPPASMGTPGIEKIDMTGAGNGQILVITNRQPLTIVFQDSESDGNLYLATDFSMGQWGSLVLMYNSNILKWIELSRSSN